jgi:hypothetical protein
MNYFIPVADVKPYGADWTEVDRGDGPHTRRARPAVVGVMLPARSGHEA